MTSWHDSEHPTRAAARHEAAHAVIARLLGGHVTFVTLESDDEEHTGQSAITWREKAEDELAELSARTALAGPLAELAFLGQDSVEDPEIVSTWRRDWNEVQAAAHLLEPTTERREALIEKWFHEVRALLADPVIDEHIARVADALAAHETLDETLFLDCFD